MSQRPPRLAPGRCAYRGIGGTLIFHWDGLSWIVQRSPVQNNNAQLTGVSAISSSEAWAVGYQGIVPQHGLIEYWNGSSWKVSRAPAPRTAVLAFFAVSAAGGRSAWAVGYVTYFIGNNHKFAPRALIEHWNGHSWKVQPSPSPAHAYMELTAVSALSTTNAWAVGYTFPGSGFPYRTFIEHWNRTMDDSAIPEPRSSLQLPPRRHRDLTD